MTSAIFFALQRRRLILAFVVLLSLIGALAWQQMNRQEDPFFPYRYGQILVEWPGADPAEIERLVLNPLEEELAQLEEVAEIRGTVRLGVAHLWIGIQQHIYDTDTAWDRIRNAVDDAEREFPPGPTPADVRDRSMDAHAVTLVVRRQRRPARTAQCRARAPARPVPSARNFQRRPDRRSRRTTADHGRPGRGAGHRSGRPEPGRAACGQQPHAGRRHAGNRGPEPGPESGYRVFQPG